MGAMYYRRTLLETGRVDGVSREERNFDAIVLSDKLLVLPNQYAVLSKSDVGALALPQLASEARVVLLVAFKHTKV